MSGDAWTTRSPFLLWKYLSFSSWKQSLESSSLSHQSYSSFQVIKITLCLHTSHHKRIYYHLWGYCEDLLMANLWTKFWLSSHIVSVRNVAKLKPNTVSNIALREKASALRKGRNTEIVGRVLSRNVTSRHGLPGHGGCSGVWNSKSRQVTLDTVFFCFSTFIFEKSGFFKSMERFAPERILKKWRECLTHQNRSTIFYFDQNQVSHLFRGICTFHKQVFIVWSVRPFRLHVLEFELLI